MGGDYSREKSVRGRNLTSHKLTASDWTGMVSDARRKKKGYNQKGNEIIIIIMVPSTHTLVPSAARPQYQHKHSE